MENTFFDTENCIKISSVKSTENIPGNFSNYFKTIFEVTII